MLTNRIIFKRLDLQTGVKNVIFGMGQGQNLKNRAATPKQEFPGLSQIVKIFWQSPLKKLAPSAVFQLVL